ncbi:hypothetical protein [Litchfieldia alkalitelluris]|uniref:hypothetical protein n=1 Tax=Litchfieldia alkalitelluris TaxID=304268 RepID=UPI001472B294|nr:hypothetical protein [Litchfieldia alkalitelluris]
MEKSQYYEKRHIFAVASIIVAISIPFALGLFPFLISDFMHHTTETWFIQLPKGSYLL